MLSLTLRHAQRHLLSAGVLSSCELSSLYSTQRSDGGSCSHTRPGQGPCKLGQQLDSSKHLQPSVAGSQLVSCTECMPVYVSGETLDQHAKALGSQTEDQGIQTCLSIWNMDGWVGHAWGQQHKLRTVAVRITGSKAHDGGLQRRQQQSTASSRGGCAAWAGV